MHILHTHACLPLIQVHHSTYTHLPTHMPPITHPLISHTHTRTHTHPYTHIHAPLTQPHTHYCRTSHISQPHNLTHTHPHTSLNLTPSPHTHTHTPYTRTVHIYSCLPPLTHNTCTNTHTGLYHSEILKIPAPKRLNPHTQQQPSPTPGSIHTVGQPSNSVGPGETCVEGEGAGKVMGFTASNLPMATPSAGPPVPGLKSSKGRGRMWGVWVGYVSMW